MKPLFMWAGGKTRLLKHYAPYMPSRVDSYCEPFFGGGAMFLHVMNTYRPQRVVLNDINPSIMAIYSSIRDSYGEFLKRLNDLEGRYIPMSKENRKSFYYDIRHAHAWDHEGWDPVYESATLYFLMKTGFNGVYQINKNTNGRYGTPSGLLNQKAEVYDRDVMSWWHEHLQSVELLSGPWQDAVGRMDDGFFFLDPPYRDSFADYGNPFNDDAQLELLRFADAQDCVMLCNRNDDGWFDAQDHSLNVLNVNVTYTAGRRKKTENGHVAKPAQEILLYRTGAVTLV